MFWPRDKVDKFKAKRQYFGSEGLEFFLFSNTWNFGFVFAFDIRLQETKKKHHFVVICTLLRRLISIYNSQVYDGVSEGEAPSADKVMQSFSSWYGQDEREEVFGEDSEYDENRKVSNSFNGKVENNDLLQRLERK